MARAVPTDACARPTGPRRCSPADDSPRGGVASAHVSEYRTQPESTERMPSGIPFIVGNEAAERFSFYGMRAILVTFMTTNLLGGDGQPAPMSEDDAVAVFHEFTMAVYAAGIVGAFFADVFFGKYRTILWLSLVYCAGHLALSLDETRLGLFTGLTLIAVGAGGIKPSVSAHVGDQFGSRNAHLTSRAFAIFYAAINVGAAASMIATPLLQAEYGVSVAFGVPGALMLLATLLFWLGRHRYAHIPPGGRAVWEELKGPSGLSALKKLAGLTLFLACFWSLFDQQGSTLVLQAQRLDTDLGFVQPEPEQLQALNPILVLILIPLFEVVIYPAFARIAPLTSVRRIALGFFIASLSFAVPAWLATRIEAGEAPSIAWHVLFYVLVTAAEVLVSTTGLDLFYAQATPRLKSMMLATFYSSVVLGNAVTLLIRGGIRAASGGAEVAESTNFAVFTGLMLFTAIAFLPYAARFRSEVHLQGDANAAPE